MLAPLFLIVRDATRFTRDRLTASV